MKKLVLIIGILVGVAHGQIQFPYVLIDAADPTGNSCSQAPQIEYVYSSGSLYTCKNGTIAIASGNGGAAFAVPAAGSSWSVPAALDPTGVADNSTAVNVYIASQVGSGIGSSQALFLPPGSFFTPTLSNVDGVPFSGPGSLLKPETQWSTNSSAAVVSSTKAQQSSYAYTAPRLMFGQEYLAHWMTLAEANSAIAFRCSGDSTTAGNNTTGNFAPCALFAQSAITRGLTGVTATNAGQSGKDTADWLSTYLATDLAASPDVYVVRWGINDSYFGLTVAQTIANIRTGLSRIRPALSMDCPVGTTCTGSFSTDQMTVILQMPSSTNDNPNGRSPTYYEQLRNGYAQAARDFHCAFIDLYGAMPDNDLASVASMMDSGFGQAGTAWSITSNVLTATVANSYVNGNQVVLEFPLGSTGVFLNGIVLTMTSASGTNFTANFTHANASATEAFTANQGSSPVHIHPGNSKTPLYNTYLVQMLLDPLVGIVGGNTTGAFQNVIQTPAPASGIYVGASPAGGGGQIFLSNALAPANDRLWDWYGDNSGTLHLYGLNDATSPAGADAATITKTTYNVFPLATWNTAANVFNGTLSATKGSFGSSFASYLTAGPCTGTSSTEMYVLCGNIAQTNTSLTPVGRLAQSTDATNPFGLNVYMQGNAAAASRAILLQTAQDGSAFSGILQLNTSGGTVQVPTATAGDNSTNAASTAFVTAGYSKSINLATGTATFTPGTNVTSVACAASYTCTNTRGELTIVGGTATTGTIATVNFSATLSSAPGMCVVTQNGGGSLFDIGHGLPSTASFTVTAGITVATATLTVDYVCQP